ncbi:redox-regulated ATPase YchF [Anaerotignum faecicola]|nr:redox-regulated ATPase YchF [Anaerotignum faecicola]
MKLGIVGLPNVGKSTLFNSMTLGKAEAANYPFCTIDPNVGVVPVPDKRLERLTELYSSEKTTPAVIEFVDIAGLVKGASKGEGLGNKFLSHIREVDAIIHVVRCFDDPNVVHVDGNVNPIRDIETINIELIFSDLEILERRISKTVKAARADKSLQKELDILNVLKETLENGKCARSIVFDDPDTVSFVESLTLLTSKPVLYAANVLEDDLADDGASNNYVKSVREYAQAEGSEVFVVCAKIEEEISELDNDEKLEFLAELGVETSGLDRLISASYKLLGLISYLTAGPQESRAWTIKNGTKAPGAAGKIHSDFERGFIRAEVVSYDDLNRLGSYSAAKEQGLVRSEGKEYVVKDGDVILFRFNV